MRTLTLITVLFVLTACTNSSESPVDVSYEGGTFSFQLKRLEDTGFTKMSGQSSGEGFRQATGELEDIFSHIWGDYRYRMDPQWKGENFNFILRFSEGEVDEDLFQKVTEEVSRQSGISIAQTKEKIAAQCLQVADKAALASHLYQMEGGVEKSLNLSNTQLSAKGMGLEGLVKHLNGLSDEDYYFYEGTDSKKYSFELDVSNPEKLGQSLSSYGISLESCQVEVKVVEIK